MCGHTVYSDEVQYRLLLCEGSMKNNSNNVILCALLFILLESIEIIHKHVKMSLIATFI